MESEDDDLVFSHAEENPSPVRPSKLRRLKKAAPASTSASIETADPNQSPAAFTARSNTIDAAEVAEPRKTADLGGSSETPSTTMTARPDTIDAAVMEKSHKTADPEGSTDRALPEPASEKFDEGSELDDSLDDLFADQRRVTPRAYWDLREGSELAALDGEGPVGGVGSGDDVLRKPAKKRRSSEEGGEMQKMKKRKGASSNGEDLKPKDSVRVQRKLEKERRAYIDLLQAESQRLLRETRDASFKPVPLIQKPISSVLEKIRLRKLEVSKRSGISDASDCMVDTGSSLKDTTKNFEAQQAESHEERTHSDANDGQPLDNNILVLDSKRANEDATTISESVFPDSRLCHHDDMSLDTELMTNSHPENVSQTIEIDTEDPQDENQESDTDDDSQSEDHTESSQEDGFTPSSLVASLKLESAHVEDDASDEEYDDKENIEPDDVDLQTKTDPVKAFVDDEAEEEDDSDNDLMRFRDNEDDDETEENEEVDDLIVSGYTEMPIDNERREELHQKWLEQQDAAATDNVLQRLNCNWKQKEQTLLEEDDENNLGQHSVDESPNDLQFTDRPQRNSKKVKQMIAHMFTDNNDDFLSSDDEETEQRLVRQRVLEQTVEPVSLLSLAEDENSREVFGRIKKLNIVPNTKKKPKTACSSSLFDTLVSWGKSNSTLKSSFLGRASSNSMPPLHKQGSSMVKSFIFGRDDSNSRSSMSISEHLLNKDDMQNRSKKYASVKVSTSHCKSEGLDVNNSNGSSGPSLFEILRQSSNPDRSDQYKTLGGNIGVGQSQVVKQFAAFVSAKRTIKLEGV